MRAENLITEVLNGTPTFIEVGHMIDEDYPSGFTGVQGYFDNISGDIEIFLVSKYKIDEDFEWDLEGKAERFFYHELSKTISHEMIHKEQSKRGESFEGMPDADASEHDYYGHPLEIEAYGRADMFAEVEANGYSETLGIYTSLFGANSKEVLKLIRFCESERKSFSVRHELKDGDL